MLHRFEDFLAQTRRRSLSPLMEAKTPDPSRAAEIAIRQKVKAIPREEALDKAKLIMELVKQKMFTHFPMWRPFWSKMPPIPSFGAGDTGPDGIGTMCTTGTAIFYDPWFVLVEYELGKINFASEFKDSRGAQSATPPTANLAIKNGWRHPMDYSLFVIIHEILHCSLKHHLRVPEWNSETISEREWYHLWNLAADYEINHILLDDVKSGLYVMAPGVVRADKEGGSFAVPADEYEFFSTSTAEKIFWRLVKNLEEKREAQKEKGEDQEQEQQETQDETQNGQDEGQEQEESGDENGEGDGGDEDGDDGDEDGEGDGGDEDGDGEGGDEDGEGGDGDGDGEGGDRPGGGSDGGDMTVKVGDVIYNRVVGEYGVVTSVSGGMIDYNPIGEDEARKRTKK